MFQSIDSQKIRLWAVAPAIVALVSCAGLPPHKEYSLARSAVSHAKKHKADKYFPRYYSKAVRLYRSGQRAFEGRYYGNARAKFEATLEHAEKAENLTRVKRALSGDYSL